jgi:hypothetical protein
MKIGLASESNLPKAYTAITSDDGEAVTLQTGSEKLTISTNSFQAVANILSLFAAEGSATLEPGTTFYIRDGFSDKETTVTANAITDVAAALTSFAVKPGNYLPAMKDEEVDQSALPTVSEEKPTAKPKGRGKKADATEAETAKAAEETKVIEQTAVEASEKPSRKKPGRKAAQKTEAASVAATPASKGRKARSQASEPAAKAEPAPVKAVEPAVATTAEAPAKRRGRPPKNRAVTETADNVKAAAPAKKTPTKKAAAPAETSNVTPIVRTPHSSGGPFPAAMTANHKNAEISGNVPGFIKELKAYYIIGENEDYRFDFTALEMEPAKRRSVVGPAKTQTADSTFGYEVKTKAGEHIGWIIIEAENKFVMAGIPEMDVSSHRNIEGPITKTGIAIANKIAAIRAKAA